MKSGFFISSLALFCFCMWTLDLFAAESSSLDSHAGVQSHGAFAVSRNGVSIGPTAQGNEVDQRELSALNLLGIRYAKGQGVKRDPRIAMRFFLLSALKGYTPAMANVGTLTKSVRQDAPISIVPMRGCVRLVVSMGTAMAIGTPIAAILPVIDIGVTLPFVKIRFQTFTSNESQYAAREYLPSDG